MNCECKIVRRDTRADREDSIEKCALCKAAPVLYAACAQMREQHAMLRGSGHCDCMLCVAARKAEGQ